jgi:hypothetical protein
LFLSPRLFEGTISAPATKQYIKKVPELFGDRTAGSKMQSKWSGKKKSNNDIKVILHSHFFLPSQVPLGKKEQSQISNIEKKPSPSTHPPLLPTLQPQGGGGGEQKS